MEHRDEQGHRPTSDSWRRQASAWSVCMFGLLATLAACAPIQPYQRGRLARPDMQLDGNADLLAGQEHATDYREGSAGGFGGSGGGCGCN